MRARDLEGFGPVGTNAPRIDVLEVMRSPRAKSLDHLSPDEFQDATEARAAVGELIAAAGELLDTCQIVVLRTGERNALERFEVALARVGGAP